MKKIIKQTVLAMLFGVCGMVQNPGQASGDSLHLVYVANKGYIPYTVISATSAMLNAGNIKELNLDLIYDPAGDSSSTSDQFLNLGDTIVKRINEGNEIPGLNQDTQYVISVFRLESKEQQRIQAYDPYSWNHTIYAKLLAPDVLKSGRSRSSRTASWDATNAKWAYSSKSSVALPANVDRCVVVDGDTFFLNLDPIAALCNDPNVTEAIGMTNDYDCLSEGNPCLRRFNAGFVYMNLEMMRANYPTDMLFTTLGFGQKEARENAKHRVFDQTFTEEHTLGLTCRDSIYRLPWRYNVLNCTIPAIYRGPDTKLLDLIKKSGGKVISPVMARILEEVDNAVMIHLSDGEKAYTMSRDAWISRGHSPWVYDAVSFYAGLTQYAASK